MRKSCTRTNTVIPPDTDILAQPESMWKLERSLGFLMNRTARSLRRALEAKLVHHGITATQYVVLVRMWEEEGTSLSELGERLYLDNPTLTGIVDRMERDSLVQRRRDKEDRRVVKVYLTPKGKSLQKEIQHFAEETDTVAWTGFSATQKQAIFTLHEKILRNLRNALD